MILQFLFSIVYRLYLLSELVAGLSWSEALVDGLCLDFVVVASFVLI